MDLVRSRQAAHRLHRRASSSTRRSRASPSSGRRRSRGAIVASPLAARTAARGSSSSPPPKAATSTRSATTAPCSGSARSARSPPTATAAPTASARQASSTPRDGVLYVIGASGLAPRSPAGRRERGARAGPCGSSRARGPSTSGAAFASSAARSTFRSPRTATPPTAAAFPRKADSSPSTSAQPSALAVRVRSRSGRRQSRRRLGLGRRLGLARRRRALHRDRQRRAGRRQRRRATAWSSSPPICPRRSAVDRPVASVDGEDIDLGAAPVLFKPSGCPALLAANDKSGDLIVWRQDALAKGPYARIPLSDGVDAFVGAPSWSPHHADALRLDRDRAQGGRRRLDGTIALKVTAKCGFTKQWFTATGDGTQPEPLVAGDLVADTGGERRRLRRRAGRHRGRRVAVPDGCADPLAADRGGRRADRRRLRRPALRVPADPVTSRRGCRSPSRAVFPRPNACRSPSSPTARARRSRPTAPRCSRTAPAAAMRRCASGSPTRHGVEPARVVVTSGSLQGFVFLAEQLVQHGRARPRRGADVRPAAEDPRRASAPTSSACRWTTTACSSTRSSERSRRARSPPSSTRSPRSRTRAGGRSRRSAAGASPSSPASTSCSCSRTTRTGSCATRARRCRRSSSWRAARTSPTRRRSRRRSRQAFASATSCCPPALAAKIEALAVSTYISPPFMTQATVHEFLRRGNFEPNLERVRGLLKARRDAMLDALERAHARRRARGAGPTAATSSGSICPRSRRSARARRSSGRHVRAGDGLLRGRRRHEVAPARVQLRLAGRDRRRHREARAVASWRAVAGVCALAARAGSRRRSRRRG